MYSNTGIKHILFTNETLIATNIKIAFSNIVLHTITVLFLPIVNNIFVVRKRIYFFLIIVLFLVEKSAVYKRTYIFCV